VFDSAAALVHAELTLGPLGSVGGFRAIAGIGSETDVVEQSSVDDHGRPIIQKAAGPARWPDITLRRPVDASRTLWEWRDIVLGRGPDAARVDGTITLLDAAGRASVTYGFANGWPIRYAVTGIDAESEAGALEEIVICHEGLQRL
jgi:phage tail-like protein